MAKGELGWGVVSARPSVPLQAGPNETTHGALVTGWADLAVSA
jgi:hypothetical protein